jgi:hypothetical protein
MMQSVRQRPFYSVGGEPASEDHDGDGDDTSGDEVGVCVPRHGPATDCHASCRAFFFTTRSSGDGDEPMHKLYCTRALYIRRY